MTRKFEVINCHLCNSKDFEIVCNKGQFNIPLNVSICKNCGFLYLNPRWTKKMYQTFYENKYDGYYRHNLGQENIKTAKQVCERIKGACKIEGKKILELGAGSGYIINYFKKNTKNNSYNVIEPSLRSQTILKKNKVNIIQDDAEKKWKTNIKFDVIILRHVLEHFLYPNFVLNEIRHHLSRDGIVYIAVPNLMYPVAPLTKSFFRAVHASYFSLGTLTSICSKNGLIAIKKVDMSKERISELYFICKHGEKTLKINKDNFKYTIRFIEKRLRYEKFNLVLFYVRSCFEYLYRKLNC